jgi:hypothetical protein
LHIFRNRIALEDAGHGRGRVTVRGRNQDVVSRDARAISRPRPGRFHQFARNHATVDNHDGHGSSRVGQHQAAGVQRISGARRQMIAHVAVHADRKLRRRDVLGIGPGLQSLFAGLLFNSWLYCGWLYCGWLYCGWLYCGWLVGSQSRLQGAQ